MQPSDESRERTRTRDAIVDAAAKLLVDSGARAVTTRAVAERAGVQAPTIYRLFGDKDGLIEAVAEQVMSTYVLAKQTAAAEVLPPIEALRAAWQRHVHFGLSNPELYALLGAQKQGQLSPATTAGIEVLRRKIRDMASAGLLVVSEGRAVEMVHAAGSGVILALLAQQPAHRDLGMADAMFDAILNAISTQEREERAGGNVLTSAIRFRTVIDDLSGISSTEKALLAEWVERAVEQAQSASR